MAEYRRKSDIQDQATSAGLHHKTPAKSFNTVEWNAPFRYRSVVGTCYGDSHSHWEEAF
jgi:hypothetical protein